MTTSLDALSVEELARRAQAGSSGALEALAARARPPLSRYISRRVRCKADEEELVQEVLLRVCQGLEQYDSARPFMNWALTIASNATVDHYRHPSRRAAALPVEALDMPGVSAEATDPSLSLSRRERAARVWQVVREQLNPRQQRAIHLRYREAKDIDEIARLMAVSKIHVRVLLHRARKRLLAGGALEDL